MIAIDLFVWISHCLTMDAEEPTFVFVMKAAVSRMCMVMSLRDPAQGDHAACCLM
jgi:hypothetical protein